MRSAGPLVVRFVLVTLSGSAITACAVQARSLRSPEIVRFEMQDAEGRRDVHAAGIEDALVSQYPTIRTLGLRVLARSEERGTSTQAASLLGDVDEQVAGWAGFALGQIGEAYGEAALLESLASVSRAPEQALLALARSGTASTAQGLVRFLDDKRSSVRAAASLALGLVAKRDASILDPEVVHPALAPLLEAKEAEIRYGASYALSRLAGPKAPALLVTVLRDVDPEVRINAARGIGASLGGPFLLDAALSDPDWRVRVEVARALGAIGKGSPQDVDAAAQRLLRMSIAELGSLAVASPLASGTALHVLRAAIEAARPMGEPGKRVLLELERRSSAFENPAPETSSDRARFECELALALDIVTSRFKRVPRCGDSSILAWRRWSWEVQFLAKRSKPDLKRLLELSTHDDSRVRIAVVEALGQIEGDVATQALLGLLDAEDLLTVSAAASLVFERLAQAELAPEVLGLFARALERTAKDPDPTLVSGVLDALLALGPRAAALEASVRALGSDPRTPVRRRVAAFARALGHEDARIGASPGLATDARPAPYHERLRAEVLTARGTFELELWGDLAPRAVGSFVALARSKLYKGRVFHRVVPGFVTQGGGERGDGWGSPGYAIEDECSPVPFVRGVLGIATAGRDTGGSQFFFMHARQPHLEGAYTAFGQITKGHEVAEALQVDDEILEVKVVGLEEPSLGQPRRTPRPGLPSSASPG